MRGRGLFTELVAPVLQYNPAMHVVHARVVVACAGYTQIYCADYTLFLFRLFGDSVDQIRLDQVSVVSSYCRHVNIYDKRYAILECLC
jgi:hypothetical protein